MVWHLRLTCTDVAVAFERHPAENGVGYGSVRPGCDSVFMVDSSLESIRGLRRTYGPLRCGAWAFADAGRPASNDRVGFGDLPTICCVVWNAAFRCKGSSSRADWPRGAARRRHGAERHCGHGYAGRHRLQCAGGVSFHSYGDSAGLGAADGHAARMVAVEYGKDALVLALRLHAHRYSMRGVAS